MHDLKPTWFDHVERMTKERLVKVVSVRDVDKVRFKGRAVA